MNRRTPRPRPAHRAGSGTGGAVLRALVLLALLAAWLVVGAFGGMAQGTLSEVQENDPAVFLPDSAESTRADELAQEFTDSSTLPTLVVVRPDDGSEVTEEHRAAAQELAEQVPGLGLPDGTEVERLLTAPVVAVPSEDGEALLLPVSLDSEGANELVGEGERAVNVVVDALREQADEDLAAAGLDAWVTGPGGFVADLTAAFAGIDGILLGVALVVVLVILVAVYRSPVLPFTVLLTAVL
ncbi:MMPL family transporter, partial [Georgenia sp. 10Sc9-8]|nr:MMPL family transporter [Georgenia halotolerans]